MIDEYTHTNDIVDSPKDHIGSVGRLWTQMDTVHNSINFTF